MASTDEPDDLEVQLLALGESLDIPVPPPAATARAVRARLEALSPTRRPPRSGGSVSSRRPIRSRAIASCGPVPSGVLGSRPIASRGPVPSRAIGSRAIASRATFPPLPGLPSRAGTAGMAYGAVRRPRAAARGGLGGRPPRGPVLRGHPVGRAAVVEILKFAGIELRIGDPGPLPSGSPRPLPMEGTTTLEEARRQVVFPIVVPAELGEPDEVRISDRGRVVSMVWPGIRLDQYDGTLEVVFRKELGPPWPEETTVDGSRAEWVPAKHGLTYLPRAGGLPVETRLSGPTLVWQRGGVGLRLEGVTDRERAREIARSVQ
nr:hypothetical protein GCM10020093_087150 [Planobispora longispora]